MMSLLLCSRTHALAPQEKKHRLRREELAELPHKRNATRRAPQKVMHQDLAAAIQGHLAPAATSKGPAPAPKGGCRLKPLDLLSGAGRPTAMGRARARFASGTPPPRWRAPWSRGRP